MLFAISDLHLSLGAEKPMNDIFANWQGYVEKLRYNWLNLVKSDDTVVIVGDISWAINLEESLKDFLFLDSLPGEKIIIKGNHDYWWTSLKKNNDFLASNNINSIKFLQNCSIEAQNFCICGTRGWNFNSRLPHDIKITEREIDRLKLSIKHAEKSKLEKVVFMHYPPLYKNNISKFVDIFLENKIRRCYYGHIHVNNFVKSKLLVDNYMGVKFTLVSCDYLDFRPKYLN
ncbi:MAG: metallophosphoesterase [Candidatus Improbicoccus pseudotrichonymphae]|uniref:Metallophosphoesterase n=1 Tax=Candidatus Improbicoccus pseudotrichonymphae TaxID=3033792 RepID=A0AA48KV67_9FIRM|nr:MAG: metallophosphoesterase [Candidatus Improbicoccus pseudotrichonymphae]